MENINFVNYTGPNTAGPLQEDAEACPGTLFYEILDELDTNTFAIRGFIVAERDTDKLMSLCSRHFGYPDIKLSISYYGERHIIADMRAEGVSAEAVAALAGDPKYDDSDRAERKALCGDRKGFEEWARFGVPKSFSERCIKIEGSMYQDLCLLEECAEVAMEITKLGRRMKSEKDIAHLTEEIGDLLIVIQTAIVNHGLDPAAIAESMHDKIIRTERYFDSKED